MNCPNSVLIMRLYACKRYFFMDESIKSISNLHVCFLLVNCAGNSLVIGEFLAQRPVTRSFDVFFDLRLNKRLSKQSWGWWFEMPSHPLWRHYNVKRQSASNYVIVPQYLCALCFYIFDVPLMNSIQMVCDFMNKSNNQFLRYTHLIMALSYRWIYLDVLYTIFARVMSDLNLSNMILGHVMILYHRRLRLDPLRSFKIALEMNLPSGNRVISCCPGKYKARGFPVLIQLHVTFLLNPSGPVTEISGKLRPHNDCWCSGSLCHQGIIRDVIGF